MKNTHFSDQVKGHDYKAPYMNLSIKTTGKRVLTETGNDRMNYSSPKFQQIQPNTPLSYTLSDTNRNFKTNSQKENTFNIRDDCVISKEISDNYQSRLASFGSVVDWKNHLGTFNGNFKREPFNDIINRANSISKQNSNSKSIAYSCSNSVNIENRSNHNTNKENIPYNPNNTINYQYSIRKNQNSTAKLAESISNASIKEISLGGINLKNDGSDVKGSTNKFDTDFLLKECTLKSIENLEQELGRVN